MLFLAGVPLFQLNVEGFTKAKCSIIEHLVLDYEATAILLQETHSLNCSKFSISGYNLAVSTTSKHHGIATFVKCSANWKPIACSSGDSKVEWAATKIEDIKL